MVVTVGLGLSSTPCIAQETHRKQSSPSSASLREPSVIWAQVTYEGPPGHTETGSSEGASVLVGRKARPPAIKLGVQNTGSEVDLK